MRILLCILSFGLLTSSPAKAAEAAAKGAAGPAIAAEAAGKTAAAAGAGGAAGRYAEAAVLEARAADSVSCLRRVIEYTRGFSLAVAEGEDALARYEETLAWAREALQADRDEPAFEPRDYEAIAQRLRRVAVECPQVFVALADKLRLKRSVPLDPSLEAPLLDPALAASSFDCSLRVAAAPGAPEGALPAYLGEADWDVIKALGFDLISPDPALFAGQRLSPGPKRRDFAALDFLLNENARRQCRTEIRLGALSGAPEWLGSSPEGRQMLAAGPDGALSNELDIFHPAARQWLLDEVRAIGEHCAHDPRVARYVLFDAPDLSRAGYSDAARRAFRAWLEERHKSVDVLNKLWDSRYVNWEGISPPAVLQPAYSRPQDALLGEFARFKCDSVLGFLSEAAAVLRSCDPDCPIVARAAPSANLGADLGLRGLDLERLAQGPWDALGLSGAGAESPIAPWRLLALSTNRAAAKVLRASPFDWFAEDLRGGASAGLDSSGPGGLRALAGANLWRELAWGRRGIDFASLATGAAGRGDSAQTAEAGGAAQSPAPFGAAKPTVPILRAAAILPLIAEQWRRVGHMLADARPADAGLGVLRCESTLAIERGPVGLAPHGGSPDLTMAVLQGLLDEGHVPALLSENAVAGGQEDLSGFRLIICPEATHMRPEAAARLREWAGKGGKLLCLGPFAVFDPYGAPVSERPILKALGISDPVRESSGRWTDAHKERRDFETARVGQGYAILRLSYVPAESVVLVQRAVREAAALRQASADFKRTACVVWDSPGGGRFAFIVNRVLEGRQKTTVSIQGRYSAALDLTAKGIPVPMSFQQGWSGVTVNLDPGQGLVLKLEPWRENPAGPSSR